MLLLSLMRGLLIGDGGCCSKWRRSLPLSFLRLVCFEADCLNFASWLRISIETHKCPQNECTLCGKVLSLLGKESLNFSPPVRSERFSSRLLFPTFISLIMIHWSLLVTMPNPLTLSKPTSGTSKPPSKKKSRNLVRYPHREGQPLSADSVNH